MIRFLLSLLVLTSSLLAHADEEEHPLLFGPEFTFWVNDGTDEGVAMVEMAEKMKVHLIDGQPEGAKFKVTALNTFESPNGWKIRLTKDGLVIEAKMDPLSAGDFANYAEHIQDALFQHAYNDGYYPAEYAGGGHISLSAKYFVDKPQLFRNFIVDLLNHSELGLGIWNFDTNNAFPMALAQESDWKKIKKALREFDKAIATDALERILKLSKTLNEVFDQIYDPYRTYWDKNKKSGPRGKHNAINLNHTGNFQKHDSRIELRMFRPQFNIDVFVRQTRLLEKRLKFLEKARHYPLHLNPNLKQPGHTDFHIPVTEKVATTPPVDPQWAIEEYFYYVVQTGEKWSDHQDYIWPKWITDGELEKFNDRKLLYGPEFTLSRLGADEAIDANQYRKHVFQHLVTNQPYEQKFSVPIMMGDNKVVPNKYTSPNGWDFFIDEDAGSIEIQMKPMSLEEWELYKDHIQDAIFESGAQTNHHAALWAGGGHINIDYRKFMDNPLLFRNFLVDLLNHNELFLGIMNYDTSNSISSSLLDDDFTEKFRKKLEDFDKDLEAGTATSDQLALMFSRLQDSSEDEYAQFWTWTGRSKYHAINLRNAKVSQRKTARIEIRGVRPQTSAYVFVNQIRLFEKRIQYLEGLGTPIALQPKVEVIPPPILTKTTILNPPVDPMAALASFHQYLTEAGESWADHRKYLWPEWLTNGIVGKYEASVGLIDTEPDCESLLILP